MDDIIYWQGIPVGVVEGGVIVWLSNAPPEAVAALGAA